MGCPGDFFSCDAGDRKQFFKVGPISSISF